MKRFSTSRSLQPGLRPAAAAAGAPAWLDLIRLRVSQIHGCELGEIHYRQKLERDGEAADRLDDLETWPISGTYTGKERVALALAELLAQPSSGESALLPRLLEHAGAELTRCELVRLVVAVEAMQDWEHREDSRA